MCLFLLILLSCGKGKYRSDKNTAGYAAEHITCVQTGYTTPQEVVAFARSLKGIRYQYGSTDPAKGFDCSGFITYVFHHFGIMVPRVSVDFTPVEREISLNDARPGDLVLFTGTDTTTSEVGHMGILLTSPGQPPVFIHSSSGKNIGVIETPLDDYYMKRYVKTIRVFPQNEKNTANEVCSYNSNLANYAEWNLPGN